MQDLFGAMEINNEIFSDVQVKGFVERSDYAGTMRFLKTLKKEELVDTVLRCGLSLSGNSKSQVLVGIHASLINACENKQLRAYAPRKRANDRL